MLLGVGDLASQGISRITLALPGDGGLTHTGHALRSSGLGCDEGDSEGGAGRGRGRGGEGSPGPSSRGLEHITRARGLPRQSSRGWEGRSQGPRAHGQC